LRAAEGEAADAAEATTSRTLFESVMKTFPDASTATPATFESCALVAGLPSPLPYIPGPYIPGI
jgi:hypothetical protein